MEHPHQFHKGHSSGKNITVWTVILGHSFSMKYFAVIVTWPHYITNSCCNILQLNCHSIHSRLCKIEAGHIQLMLPLIFCMKNLVLEWVLNFFQDAMMVARSSHPIDQTLICVISSCGASCRTVLPEETWSVTGTWSHDYPVVQNSFRLIVP
jgi:hypothetical protein